MNSPSKLQAEILTCRKCRRLVAFREKVAREKRRAYMDWIYWGKPVPSFGKPDSRLLIIGLAPAAHGANRTGRMFTGDSSGDLLYSTLYKTGFCNQKNSSARNDGMELRDAYITAALHCVPPQNKPTAQEKKLCRDYLIRELQLMTNLRVVVALGKIAWDSYLISLESLGRISIRPRPRFTHQATFAVDQQIMLIGSYHPSRQNTQTGRLSRQMFEEVFETARAIIGPS